MVSVGCTFLSNNYSVAIKKQTVLQNSDTVLKLLSILMLNNIFYKVCFNMLAVEE